LDVNLIGPAGSGMLLEVVRERAGSHPVDLTVPYEWFEKRQSPHVLVLLLDEDKLATGALEKLRRLISDLTPAPPEPKTTAINNAKEDSPNDTPKIFVPSATIPACELGASMPVTNHFSKEKMAESTWDCFTKNPPQLNELTKLPIIRTIGTDDVLAAALLWELWQRGVNRELAYQDKWWMRKWEQVAKGQNPATFPRQCADGLVLISEWDSEYARALSRNLAKGFSDGCKANGNPSRVVR